MKKLPIHFIVAVSIVLIAVFVTHKDFFIYHARIAFSTPAKAFELELINKASQDPAQALALLKEKIQHDASIVKLCHGLAHQIGHEAYKTFGTEAVAKGNYICGAGYVHGVIESAFLGIPPEKVPSKIRELCGKEPSEKCLHGIGHGFMVMTHENITESVALCESISTIHSDCYDGAFMHIFDNEDTGMMKEIISYKEASALCTTMVSGAKNSCYFYLPRTLKGYSNDVVVNACEGIKDAVSREECTTGSGVMFIKYDEHYNESVANEACDRYHSHKDQKACRLGVAHYFEFNLAER